MTVPIAPRPTDLVLAMTGASGAPYAVAAAPDALPRSGRTVHLTISPSGAQVLREETGPRRSPSTGFDPLGLRRPRPRPGRLSPPRGLLRRDRQRLVPDRRHGRRPVQHEHPGRDRPRDHHEPDHPGGRRPPEGAPQADPGPARDAAEPDPPREHGCASPAPGRSSCRRCPAGITGRDRSTTSIEFVVGADLRPARRSPIALIDTLGRSAGATRLDERVSAPTMRPRAAEGRPGHRGLGRASARRSPASLPRQGYSRLVLTARRGRSARAAGRRAASATRRPRSLTIAGRPRRPGGPERLVAETVAGSAGSTS